MVDKETYEKSDFDERIQTPDFSLEGEDFRQSATSSLGNWDFDYQGSGFIVGSGVYEVEFETCQSKSCENYDTKECDKRIHYNKTKTRGFTEKSLGTTLKELAKQNPSGIPIENERPLTIPEVLINPDNGNVAEFVKSTKELNPNFDTKRNWAHGEIDFEGLLNTHDTSTPLFLKEELISDYDDHTPKFKEAERNIADPLNW